MVVPVASACRAMMEDKVTKVYVSPPLPSRELCVNSPQYKYFKYKCFTKLRRESHKHSQKVLNIIIFIKPTTAVFHQNTAFSAWQLIFDDNDTVLHGLTTYNGVCMRTTL